VFEAPAASFRLSASSYQLVPPDLKVGPTNDLADAGLHRIQRGVARPSGLPSLTV